MHRLRTLKLHILKPVLKLEIPKMAVRKLQILRAAWRACST
jgi:hypothetical protein